MRVAGAPLRRLRVLYATAESHPTYRPDVRVLFGESLPAAGIDVDLMAVVEGAWPPPAPSVWYVWIDRPAMAASVDST
jgi:hypothetical protein